MVNLQGTALNACKFSFNSLFKQRAVHVCSDSSRRTTRVWLLPSVRLQHSICAVTPIRAAIFRLAAALAIPSACAFSAAIRSSDCSAICSRHAIAPRTCCLIEIASQHLQVRWMLHPGLSNQSRACSLAWLLSLSRLRVPSAGRGAEPTIPCAWCKHCLHPTF